LELQFEVLKALTGVLKLWKFVALFFQINGEISNQPGMVADSMTSIRGPFATSSSHYWTWFHFIYCCLFLFNVVFYMRL